MGHEPDAGRKTKLLQLRIESGGPWWLDIEVRADASLDDLDHFLRRIWLECCGHLSAFFPERGRDEYENGPLTEIFAGKGTGVRYEYDFGSTTELRLRGAGWRDGMAAKNAVRLLARNEPPQWTCGTCEKPATWICPFIHDEEALMCDLHSDNHRCDEPECHLPVVDSPRMGVCGYTGPPR